jgi:hypothetical protein
VRQRRLSSRKTPNPLEWEPKERKVRTWEISRPLPLIRHIRRDSSDVGWASRAYGPSVATFEFDVDCIRMRRNTGLTDSEW